MVVDGDTYVGADIKNYFALLYLTDSEEMDLPKKKKDSEEMEDGDPYVFPIIRKAKLILNSQNQNAIGRKI